MAQTNTHNNTAHARRTSTARHCHRSTGPCRHTTYIHTHYLHTYVHTHGSRAWISTARRCRLSSGLCAIHRYMHTYIHEHIYTYANIHAYTHTQLTRVDINGETLSPLYWSLRHGNFAMVHFIIEDLLCIRECLSISMFMCSSENAVVEGWVCGFCGFFLEWVGDN